MKKTLLSIAVTVVALAFALPTFADTNAPAKPPKPPRQQFTGDIKSIDATTHALTVVNKDGLEKAFGLSETVRVSTSTIRKAAVADLKVGDKVKVTYTETDGKLTAVRISPPDVPKKPKTDATN